MEFIFDILAEIIMEPIIEGYLLAMSHFSNGSKKVDEDKVKTIVVLESVALFLIFAVGGIMLAESSGKSPAGNFLLISSITVSTVQILVGIAMKRLKKKTDIRPKISNTGQLKDLISRMCNDDDCSAGSIRSQVYLEAEKLSDTTFLPFLQETVLKNQKNSKEDKNIRTSVYHIIANIIKNSFDEAACKFLIERLDIETDKYILSDILGLLVWIEIPWNIDIESVIRLSKSDNWLIRHSAVQALGSSKTIKSKEAIKYYLNQADEKKYEYEIIYGNFALGKIGKFEDVPVLEQHLNSRIRDIRESAAYAIKNIKNRDS